MVPDSRSSPHLPWALVCGDKGLSVTRKGREMPTAKKLQIVEELTERDHAELPSSSGPRTGASGDRDGNDCAASSARKGCRSASPRTPCSGWPPPRQVSRRSPSSARALRRSSSATATPSETAKAVREYAQSAKNAFAPRRAFMEGQLLSARDLADIATLPPRPIMMGRLAGNIQAPVYRLAQLLASTFVHPTGQLLNSSLFQLAGLLDARAKQLEQA